MARRAAYEASRRPAAAARAGSLPAAMSRSHARRPPGGRPRRASAAASSPRPRCSPAAGSARVADKPGGRVLAIGLGARDVALALGTLRALRGGRGARRVAARGHARRRGGPRRDAPRARRAAAARGPGGGRDRRRLGRCSAPGCSAPLARRSGRRRRARATRSCASVLRDDRAVARSARGRARASGSARSSTRAPSRSRARRAAGSRPGGDLVLDVLGGGVDEAAARAPRRPSSTSGSSAAASASARRTGPCSANTATIPSVASRASSGPSPSPLNQRSAIVKSSPPMCSTTRSTRWWRSRK